jgi:hypothetical protein
VAFDCPKNAAIVRVDAIPDRQSRPPRDDVLLPALIVRRPLIQLILFSLTRHDAKESAMAQSTDLDSITVAELPDDGVVDTTLHSLLDVYSEHGYDQGYSRATRDLLAVYPLLIEQFLHQRPEVGADVRKLLRDFGRFVEDRIGQRLTEAGFTDGAGI